MKLASQINPLNNTYNFITQQQGLFFQLNHKFEQEQKLMAIKASEIPLTPGVRSTSYTSRY
jgi:hypothetical protein